MKNRSTTMKRTLNASTAMISSALILVFAAPAMAQDQAPANEADAAIDPSEIVVTARRRAELLQDVPISITVYNQEQIADRNIVVASDLATYTPSLSVNQRFGPEKSTFGIRGFNQDISTAPAVGVYFADVVGVRAQGGTTSGNTVGAGAFMDLQNVQVLKGPQGTLFGRNTTGGAVLLVPNKPSDEFEGNVEFQLGNYNMMRGQAVLNVPVADWLKIRVGFDRNVREGYMRNRSGIGPDDYNNINYFYGRFSMVAKLSPNLENYTIFHSSNSHTHGRASRITICDASAPAVVPLAPGVPPPPGTTNLRGVTAAAACDQIARQNARGDSLLDVDVSNPNPFLRLKQWQAINTTTWEAADWLTVKNIASYGEFRENVAFNLFSDNFRVASTTLRVQADPTNQPVLLLPLVPGTPFKYIQLDAIPGEHAAAQRTMTEELQFQGTTAGGRFTWVVGGYLEFSRPIGWNYQHTGAYLNCASPGRLQCANPIFIGSISASRTKFDFDNHGIFAQGTFNFTEQLALTIGGRYTFDKIHGQNESTRINFLPGGGGVRNRQCNDQLRFNVPDNTNLPPDANIAPDPLLVTSPAQCHSEINISSKRPTWLIDLDYKPTDDILIYAKYSRGYRQGGINFTNPGLETWDPEKVDAFEVGAKTAFRTGSLRGYVNIAAFYNDFSNQQVFGGLVAKPESGIVGGAAIINAGKSVIKGFEIDASANPFSSLRLDLGYTYLHTKVKELIAPTLSPDSPFQSVSPTARVGQPLTFSPKHRLTLTGTYTLPLKERLGELSVGVTWVYTSRQIADAGMPAAIGVLPATNLFNFNVNWDAILGSPLDAAFFMTNVTDEIYSVGTGGAWNSGGFGDIIPAQPRMYGFRLRYSFGD